MTGLARETRCKKILLTYPFRFKPKKNCCRRACRPFSEKEVVDEKGLKAYLDAMELSKEATLKSFEDGVVDR